MKIKTFPLQFTEQDLNEIREAASFLGMTIKEFIMTAIQEKMQKGGCKRDLQRMAPRRAH